MVEPPNTPGDGRADQQRSHAPRRDHKSAVTPESVQGKHVPQQVTEANVTERRRQKRPVPPVVHVTRLECEIVVQERSHPLRVPRRYRAATTRARAPAAAVGAP